MNATPSDFSNLAKLFQEPEVAPAEPSLEPRKKSDPKDIWDENDLEKIEEYDPRPEPEYELKYSQNVSSEDMYLGMSGKTPSFQHADNLSLTVKLPKVQLSELDINVQKSFIEVMCPLYKLKVYLPQAVDKDKGTAKWEKDTNTLRMVVPLSKEFSF